MTTMVDNTIMNKVLLKWLYRGLRHKTENPIFLWGSVHNGEL